MPGVLVTAQVPLLVALAAFAFYRVLRRGGEAGTFLIALGLFCCPSSGSGSASSRRGAGRITI